jgi:hypothetical protein
MLVAGEFYVQTFGRVYCAKLYHDNDKRCIFHHGYDKGLKESPALQPPRQPGR